MLGKGAPPLRYRKTLTVVGIFAVAAGATAWALIRTGASPATAAPVFAQVQRGPLTLTASETGTLAPELVTPVRALSQGQITGPLPTVGESITQGDVLVHLSSLSLETSLEQAQLQVNRIGMQIKNAAGPKASPQMLADLKDQQAAVVADQAALASDQALVAPETVTASVGGVVANVSVQDGDQVSNGAPLLTLLTPSVMSLSGLTSGNTDGASVGTEARVIVGGSIVQGVVTSIGAATRSGRITGYPVTVTVQNPGTMAAGQQATALVHTGTADFTLEGFLKDAGQRRVTAPMQGVVSQLAVGAGSAVKPGTPLLVIDNPSAAQRVAQDQQNLQRDQNLLQATTHELQQASAQGNETLALLENQLKSAETTVSYDLQQQQKLAVRSPVTGVVTAVPVDPGALIGKYTVIADVADLSQLLLDVPLVQSEINDVHVGESVSVTSTGVPGTSFAGTVTEISVIGNDQNGISSFPVTVTIPHPGLLKPGMAAVADFSVKTVAHALYVPVVAVRETPSGRPYVLVKGSGGVAEVRVTLGLETDQYAQITKGVTAGEEVAVTGFGTTTATKRSLNVKGTVLHRQKPARKKGKP